MSQLDLAVPEAMKKHERDGEGKGERESERNFTLRIRASSRKSRQDLEIKPCQIGLQEIQEHPVHPPVNETWKQAAMHIPPENEQRD